MALPALATATSAHHAANRANATSPQRSAHRIPYNDRAAHRANATCPCSAPPAPITSPPRIALRGPRIALRGPHTLRSTLRWFRLVRGTIFSKIQYIYIFIFQIFMTHLVYWLRCENLICGPRFDSGTRRVIVVGPRRRPCCNDDFTTAEK